ncbi:MAG: site-2 protease family protein [Kouleothrix sp.]|nr:site-2 protease family protein [Kouleothrix sp.]
MDYASVENIDRLEIAGRVRASLQGLMDVDSYQWDDRGTLTLRGRLSGPSDTLYQAIRARIEEIGFTPFLRQGVDADADELVAMPGVVDRRKPRVALPVALFLITVFTVLLTGALNNGANPLTNPISILAGVPFAATLLGILFTHEMGHYVVGRLRHAPVSLPYFIPLPPFLSFTGTMGAVIVQREPMEDRRTVLEVGIAGPLAGLAVAIPLLIFGLAASTIGPPPATAGGYIQEGNSLLYIAAKWVVFGRFLPSGGVDVQLGPVAWGAWIGLLVTMLNLLPIGQLDGGHVAYALLGERAHYLAYALIAACVALGLLVSNTWLLWALLAFLIGPRHPPPLNDISRLDGRHAALAIFGLVVFVLLFMPAPLAVVGA